MTIKISCKLNESFNCWNLWTVEYEENDYSGIQDLEQEDFDQFTDKLYKKIQEIPHIDKRYIKHHILTFYVMKDIKYNINSLLTNCLLNRDIRWN